MGRKLRDSLSMMGYRDDSPYRHAKSLNIYSPEGSINMDGVSQDLVINDGEMILPANSGTHIVPTDKNGIVKETRLNAFQNGGGKKLADQVTNEKNKKRFELTYNPLKEKLHSIYGDSYNPKGWFTDLPTDVNPKTANFLEDKLAYQTVSGAPVEGRVMPPFQDELKEMQSKILNLSDDQIKLLLSKDFSNIGTLEALGLASNLGVGLSEAKKYLKYFNTKKQQGYTFQHGGRKVTPWGFMDYGGDDVVAGGGLNFPLGFGINATGIFPKRKDPVYKGVGAVGISKQVGDNLNIGAELSTPFLKNPRTKKLDIDPNPSLKAKYTIPLKGKGKKKANFLQNGGGDIYTYSGRPEAEYQRDAQGQWMINLGDQTKNEFIPIKDPTGSRANILNKQATLKTTPEQVPYYVQNFLAGVPKKEENNDYVQGMPAHVPVASTTAVHNLPQMPEIKKVTPKTMMEDQQKYERAVEQEFQKNAPWIREKYGDDKVDELLYDKDGQYDWNKMGQLMATEEYATDIEDTKYADFRRREQKAYDEAPWYDKTLSFMSATMADPALTIQNLIFEGQAPMYGQWQGLNEGTNTDARHYKRATGYDDNWLNTGFNFINPLHYTGDAVLADNPTDAGLNLTNALLLGRMGPTGAGSAKVLNAAESSLPYIKSAPQGIKNIFQGNASPRDLFTRNDLARFMSTKEVQSMESRLAQGVKSPLNPTGHAPSDFMWHTSMRGPDALKYAQQYGDDIMHTFTPTTRAAASEYNLATLAKKLKNNPNLGTAERARIEDALEKTVPSKVDIANNPSIRKFYNEQSAEMRKKIDEIIDNPEGYWKTDLYKNDEALQKVLANKSFYNTAEYLPPLVSPTGYSPITMSGVSGLMAPVIDRGLLQGSENLGVSLGTSGATNLNQ